MRRKPRRSSLQHGVRLKTLTKNICCRGKNYRVTACTKERLTGDSWRTQTAWVVVEAPPKIKQYAAALLQTHSPFRGVLVL